MWSSKSGSLLRPASSNRQLISRSKKNISHALIGAAVPLVLDQVRSRMRWGFVGSGLCASLRRIFVYCATHAAVKNPRFNSIIEFTYFLTLIFTKYHNFYYHHLICAIDAILSKPFVHSVIMHFTKNHVCACQAVT